MKITVEQVLAKVREIDPKIHDLAIALCRVEALEKALAEVKGDEKDDE